MNSQEIATMSIEKAKLKLRCLEIAQTMADHPNQLIVLAEKLFNFITEE